MPEVGSWMLEGALFFAAQVIEEAGLFSFHAELGNL